MSQNNKNILNKNGMYKKNRITNHEDQSFSGKHHHTNTVS